MRDGAVDVVGIKVEAIGGADSVGTATPLASAATVTSISASAGRRRLISVADASAEEGIFLFRRRVSVHRVQSLSSLTEFVLKGSGKGLG